MKKIILFIHYPITTVGIMIHIISLQYLMFDEQLQMTHRYHRKHRNPPELGESTQRIASRQANYIIHFRSSAREFRASANCSPFLALALALRRFRLKSICGRAKPSPAAAAE